MALILWLTLLLFAKESLTYECCKDDMCSPPQLEYAHMYADNEILLPEATSGCLCKEFPNRYLKCFGRNTCHEIPRDLNITVPDFRITTTNIRIIRKDDLARYINLTQLDIENHSELESIEEYSFATLKNLANLSISFNPKLTFLKPETFAGLNKLLALYLTKNGFSSIIDISAALGPRYLPALYELELKENDFAHIRSTDFEPMEFSTLRKLNLVNSRINRIDSGSLNVFKQLEVLRIGINPIEIQDITNLILSMMEEGIELKSLNLYKIGFKEILPKELLEAIGNSTIECLSLAGNQFSVITNDSFPLMENIRLLDLRAVAAVDITKDAFRPLPNLRTLLLGDNKISTIPEGAKVENLTYLDINSFSKYSNHYCYFTVHNFTFSKLTKLNLLNLSYNTIQTIYKSTFFGLSSLTILSLRNCDIFYLEPGSFRPLRSLTFLDLEKNHFAISKTQPLDTNLFEGLENLKVLLLGGNRINYLTNLTFSSLKSLKHLSLNDNQLVQLDNEHLKYMTKLSSLALQRNSLIPWTTKAFQNQKDLSVVYLGRNKITNFSTAMLDDFRSLSNIDLSHNNFICDCQLYEVFNDWEEESNVNNATDLLRRTSAVCFPTELTITEYLISTKRSKDCDIKVVELSVLVASLALLLGMLCFWIYYYRWHIRYYIFLTKLHLIRKGKRKVVRKKAASANCEYDAFVSYSNEDSNFVIRLVAMLENYEPHLKLCVYERDFKIGSIISDSVLENVIKSRKVLLVISDNYVKSQWCQWETHIAQHCNLFYKNDTADFVDDNLVLIRLGPVSQKHLTPTLRYLLKTRIYLQWDENQAKQDVFWKKLRENLSSGKGESSVFTLTTL